MSDWSDVCDALLADLQTNVAALGAATVTEHLYAPWDPEELAASPGEKHLAIWPAGGEEAAVAIPWVTDGGALLQMVVRILYWEHLGTESATGTADTAAADALLDLENAVRARLFTKSNFTLGGAVDQMRYVGTRFPDRPGAVRWLLVTVQASRSLGAT